MDRRDVLLSFIDADGFGLEIGPSYNPLLPKSAGYRVETIDYTDQAGLIEKYRRDRTVDTSRIEPVDYVSDGRSMSEQIGEAGRYDFIVASHVIEHVPDLVGFLNDCDRLLKPDGVLALAIPDKRCCFDLYQPVTSLGDVLEAARAKRTRPSFASVFNETAFGVRQDGEAGWRIRHDGRKVLFDTLANAERKAEGAAAGTYVDVHVWRFVPSSLQLILQDLFDLGAVRLRISEAVIQQEFLIAMTRSGGLARRDRIELLDASWREQAEGVPAFRGGLDERLSAAEARLHEQTLARTDAETLLDQERAARAYAESELHRMATSRTWRLTAPVRAAVGHVRRAVARRGS